MLNGNCESRSEQRVKEFSNEKLRFRASEEDVEKDRYPRNTHAITYAPTLHYTGALLPSYIKRI